jgi:hypothetical protein
MQRVITDPFELCLSLAAAIVEQVADAAAAAIAICRLLNRTRARARAFAPFYGRPSVGARSPS